MRRTGRIANRLAVRGASVTGRTVNDRTVIRDGRQRSFRFSVRRLTFPEVSDWLLAAGFGEVDGVSGHGEDLTLDAPRMVIVAR